MSARSNELRKWAMRNTYAEERQLILSVVDEVEALQLAISKWPVTKDGKRIDPSTRRKVYVFRRGRVYEAETFRLWAIDDWGVLWLMKDCFFSLRNALTHKAKAVRDD